MAEAPDTTEQLPAARHTRGFFRSPRNRSGGWDSRFHVSPSHFNGKNHSYYKEYFDKPAKVKEEPNLKPIKTMDPYLQNERKGTRWPKYSKIAKERDVYGEMGWIDNFNVMHSKNNTQIHPTFKYFRATAPAGSILRQTARKDRTFYQLGEDKGNKYKVKSSLERTLEGSNMIPFLRASS